MTSGDIRPCETPRHFSRAVDLGLHQPLILQSPLLLPTHSRFFAPDPAITTSLYQRPAGVNMPRKPHQENLLKTKRRKDEGQPGMLPQNS